MLPASSLPRSQSPLPVASVPLPLAMATSHDQGRITLCVEGIEGCYDVQCKIKRRTPMRKLMQAYCKRLGYTMFQVEFWVDDNLSTAHHLLLHIHDLVGPPPAIMMPHEFYINSLAR